MINKLFYYISNQFDPYINLATEKFLLDTLPPYSCILFLWQNENTIVIGTNQNPWVECNCALLESDGIKLARRLSGGGAVFHDLGNLNFTFLCSSKDYDLQKQMTVIQKACELSGISAEISGRNDILANGKKFSGNAFYSSKGNSYHHGTILISANLNCLQKYLTPSKIKLEAKGIKSTRSRVINLSELSPKLDCNIMKQNMLYAFNSVYGLDAVPYNDIDQNNVLELSSNYSSWNYLYGISMPFTFTCEEHFNWGNVQLNLNVSKGIIKSIKLYTDSMDHNLSQVVEDALSECQFNKSAICTRFTNKLPQHISVDLIEMINKQEI